MKSLESLRVFAVFLRLGLTSFGGPIAHLGYFRTEFVERREWLSESQYAQLLAICQFLPGPASSQVGFSIGLMRAGWAGAMAAFLAFTLPSALLLLLFAAALPLFSTATAQAGLQGLKLVACAVVADAVWGMFGKLCRDAPTRIIALISALALIFLSSAQAQIAVVVLGALAGLLLRPRQSEFEFAVLEMPHGRRSGAVLLAIFAGLLLGLPLLASSGAWPALADAFYRAGALVFGGGHVVLPLLQESTVTAGAVSNDAFLSGYGAAQAIPGPLFSFAAFLGALIAPAGHAVLGAAAALLFIFLPGFLLVAGVLPFWTAVGGQPSARAAIAGTNAAVVGVLAAALYDPILRAGVTHLPDFAIAAAGFLLLARWKVSPLWVVAGCVSASLLASMI